MPARCPCCPSRIRGCRCPWSGPPRARNHTTLPTSGRADTSSGSASTTGRLRRRRTSATRRRSSAKGSRRPADKTGVASVFARRRLGLFGLACALALLVAAPAQAARSHVVNVCPPVLPGFMHCDSAVVQKHGVVAHRAALGDIPYGPADIQDAYGLTSVAAAYGADQTVAIVDAYDLPSAEHDLNVYRAHYGLPACTVANGCFKKVNQLGSSTSFPAYNSGWAGEISLDLDAVSAACPHCHILLVEATSASTGNLAAAVNRAALMGATQISNSYGGDENLSELTVESAYNHPGVAVTVSSGDYGYGVEFPAASRYVTAVGGTSLVKDSSARGWSESAWD